jgi:hypothetical protein
MTDQYRTVTRIEREYIPRPREFVFLTCGHMYGFAIGTAPQRMVCPACSKTVTPVTPPTSGAR